MAISHSAWLLLALWIFAGHSSIKTEDCGMSGCPDPEVISSSSDSVPASLSNRTNFSEAKAESEPGRVASPERASDTEILLATASSALDLLRTAVDKIAQAVATDNLKVSGSTNVTKTVQVRRYGLRPLAQF